MFTALAGALVGTAVADALGVPYENLSPRRAARLLGPPDRHRLLFGRGMSSDDADHARMACEALAEAPADPAGFAAAFGRRLRWWLAAAPAGVGLATLRAGVKLWAGFPAHRSGVVSAGNGPAMRAPVLGAALADVPTLKAFVTASTRVTHTDPKAARGAFAAALAAWAAARGRDTPADYFALHAEHADPDPSGEFPALLDGVRASLAAGQPTAAFALDMCGPRGVSGYVYRTVPVALHAWLSAPRDCRRAVATVIACGGDADTTAAVVGGIVGAGVGPAGLPADWVAGYVGWPYPVAGLERLAAATTHAVATGTPARPPRASPGAVPARNAAFLAAVLAHAARRELPPY